MNIKDLSKSEMATYLYVRDIIKNEAEINNYFSITSITSMMINILPIILIIIFILIVILFYKTNEK